MRWPSNRQWLLGAGAVALVAAIPAISQDAPESILPPGFGDPVEETTKPDQSQTSRPADLLPDVGLKVPTDTTARAPADAGTEAPAAVDPLSGEPVSEEDALATAAPVLQDLPAQARRSLDRIGVLDSADGDLGPTAFGAADGRYLAYLMKQTKAPVASRWASILLRRALLSNVDTPASIAGPDWVAERAWLLLRMGEADAALMLVQSVDPDRFTPRLQDVGLQAALAAADPSAACAFSEWVDRKRTEAAWPMVRAICSGLSGESAQASAQIDAARDRRPGKGIDGLLAEKVIGAGSNTRRSVKIQWEGVGQLTAWRYGLATATAVDIPDALYASVGPHVRAWQARAPMLAPEKRQRAADIAAALGVFSNDALVDFYGQVADATDPADQSGKAFVTLRSAYAAPTPAGRLDAMKALWTGGGDDPLLRYARTVLTARAAAMLPPSDDFGDASPDLIASMLSAGFDVQAARWKQVADDAGGSAAMKAWGLLAVGAADKAVPWSRSNVESYISDAGSETQRGKFLFAGMAGLGRISSDDISDIASNLAIPVGRSTAWTKALDRAVNAREPGTVALLCALGLQGGDFRRVSPAGLYHAVSALRRVGLGAEARMIAAEALTRS